MAVFKAKGYIRVIEKAMPVTRKIKRTNISASPLSKSNNQSNVF